MRVFFLMNTFEAKSFIPVTIFNKKSFSLINDFIFVNCLRIVYIWHIFCSNDI